MSERMSPSTSPPELFSRAGTTSVGLAMMRARESRRADRLFEDPFAAALANAAREAFLAVDAPSGSRETWTHVVRLVEAFGERRVRGVRAGDDLVVESVSAGCRQVVTLGAGLDTRAFRLPLPSGTTVFEIDGPQMVAFTQAVLDAEGATPACRRRVVAADLCGTWWPALLAAGFREDIPTLWFEEGALACLSRADAWTVAARATALSSPDSRICVAQTSVDHGEQVYLDLARYGRDEPGTVQPLTGLGLDTASRLVRWGWDVGSRVWHGQGAALTGEAPGPELCGAFVLGTRPARARERRTCEHDIHADHQG